MPMTETSTTQGGQLVLDLPHRPAFDRGDLLVSDCNREAVAWIDAWPNWPAATWGLNVHGPEACGKTHLGEVWARKTGAVRIPLDELTVENVPARLREVRYAVLDDAGEERLGVAALHLYNLVVERRGALLILSRVPLARMTVSPPDLKSRLAALPAVAVREPDDNLIAGVMEKLFRDRQLFAGDEVLAFLVSRMERSFAAARAAVEAIDRLSLAEGRRITLPLAKRVLDADG